MKYGIDYYNFNGILFYHYAYKDLHNTFIINQMHNIFQVCMGEKLYYNNYIWLFLYDNFNKYPIKNRSSYNIKSINCYDINNKFIKKYDSITAARKELLMNVQNIYTVQIICLIKLKLLLK